MAIFKAHARFKAHGGKVFWEDYNEVILNFSGTRYKFNTIPAHRLRKLAQGDGWSDGNLLKDKIVLIGGTYSASRDFHVTPVGELSGVELIAYAIQSELDEEIRVPPDKIIVFVVEFLCGVIFLLCRRFFTAIPWPSLEIAAIAISFFLLAGAGSLVVFESLGHWFNFVPTIFAVLLHQMYEQGEDLRKLKKQLNSGNGE